MGDWFGKDCIFQVCQFEKYGEYEDETQPVLVYCNNNKNKHDHEGNCANNWCPLNANLITVIAGDVTLAKEDIIAHQVNCKGVMGSGVAKCLKNKYERVFSEYSKYVRECKMKNISPLGKCQLVGVTSNKYVANLFGQDSYGYGGKQYTNLKALRCAMDNLFEYASKHNLTIAMPYKIASDRGGADWGEVLVIIETLADKYKVKVTLYKY